MENLSNSAISELILMAFLIGLTLVISGTAFFFFFRTYRKEMREKEAAKQQKLSAAQKSDLAN